MGNALSAVFRCIGPSLLEQVKYISGLEDNLEALKVSILKLDARNADVLAEVRIQERNRLLPLQEVQLWLSEVEKVEPQVCLLLDASAFELQRLCMYGYCSNNLCSTYRYAKEVWNKLKIVERLLSTKHADEILARKGLPPYMEEGPIRHTVGLEKMLQSTWGRLMKEDLGILGLYGMGGVGKTTLLGQINNKFSETRDEFDIVIYVVVSQDLQIGRIQKEIGNRLGFNNEWEQRTTNEKASDIYKSLATKRFVLLLDDLWRKVDIEAIGIPLPSTENKSKVVFTTRSQEVCGYMGADVDMEVKCLEPEDAWILFQKKVRANTLAKDPKIPELARIVCGKCKGLPLALNVIGETMASKTSVHDWRYAIDKLDIYAAEDKKVKDEILRILKFSYDDLEDERVQQCFQYCALFPEDHLIEKDILVEYWICEGIIVEDREKAMNQGYGIIGILVSACLLMNYEDTEKVIMHDVVRHTALWIASKCGEEKENLVVRTGAGVHQMPEVGDWKAVTRMSLQNSEIRNISVTPECSNLTTLLLQKNKLVNISGEFFLLMPKLVVLDLSLNQHLHKLPEEVSMLVGLRYLNLAATKLENLPVGLKKLTKLKYLDLTAVYTLRSIIVISSLVNLETLMLGQSTFLTLELIEEIELLKNLKVLHVSINNTLVLERLLSIPRLASCVKDILLEGIVEAEISFAKDAASLSGLMIFESLIFNISIRMGYGCRSPNTICFQNLSSVNFTSVRCISNLTWLLFAPNLKVLVLARLLELQEVISRENISGMMNEEWSIKPFQKLHMLIIDGLVELKSIYWEPLDFPCLTMLIIHKCPKLKKLPFNKESFKGNLVKLAVDNKEWFEEIEWEDEDTKDLLYKTHQEFRANAFYAAAQNF